MKKYKIILLFVAFVFLINADFKSEDLDTKLKLTLIAASKGEGIKFFKLPDSENLAAIPQDDKNYLNPALVELGKFMFHETALAVSPNKSSSRKTYSCASCHSASTGFYSGTVQGIGEGGLGFGHQRIIDSKYFNNALIDEYEMDVQPIRTPTILNSAYQTTMVWNGQFGATDVNADTFDEWKEGTPMHENHRGFEGLETQAIAGLSVHNQKYNASIGKNKTYKKLFNQAFTNLYPWERFRNKNTGKAIAAYERTVLANEAPFQKWIRGDETALSEEEKEGAILFFGKANCVKCHTGPALNSMEFHALGMNSFNFNPNAIIPDFGDFIRSNLGRGGFTNISEDNYKFKVPQLYNLEDSKFYGHGASFKSIEEVIKYKNNANKENYEVPDKQLAQDFIPLGLSETEIKSLTLFLSKSLYDPNLIRYQPESLPTGNCFPNADKVSKKSFGCVQE